MNRSQEALGWGKEQLKTHQLAQDELSQNLSQEASRATAAEEGLQRTAEGLAAQLAQQGGEQLAMAERSKELAALMEQGHAEAKASQEAEKTALDKRLQEEQKAAEASREALQDMVSEMSRNAEAQLQQEKDRALEAEQGLREGLLS
ncbi:unnamed protein product [Effrenium voratum]|nr:unnamed protein product [Effrenium voratum]